jgi:transcriptional regulator with XRE-family HTH domain
VDVSRSRFVGSSRGGRTLIGVGRYQTHVSHWRRKDGPRWSDPYYLDWAMTVGDRIRHLRKARDWSLRDLAQRVPKPEGGHFSTGYFSRLERGWASPPLWVYTVIAERFELAPGRLLGVEGFEQPVGEAELMLIRLIRRLGLEPDEVIARVVGSR